MLSQRPSDSLLFHGIPLPPEKLYSVKPSALCMIGFHMICSLLNILSHHLWVQISKSTLLYLEHWEEKAHGLTDLINGKGFWRTAPATPGLLNTLQKN